MRLSAFLVAILITVTSTAQSPLIEDLKLARKYFSLQEFNHSRILFESVEVHSVLESDDIRRLARIYEAIGDREDAILRSQHIIQMEDVQNDDFLYLAELLKKEARYGEALYVLENYAQRGGENARRQIESVEFAQSVLEYEKNCDLENLAYNTSSAESGITFYQGNLVYSTHRVELEDRFGIKGSLDKRPKSVLLQIQDESIDAKPLKIQDREGEEFGFASYSEDGRIMVYVKSNFNPKASGLSHTKDNMSLYYSVADESGIWKEDKAFPYNSTLYANGFPYISKDGETLFYASNMKDGEGGFDLYVSHYRDSQWTLPENLGNHVNTEGNEITPFVSDNKLYFASDYLPGLGGYDVFSINNVENEWVDLNHMGACVNSPEDDYGFILDPEKKSAYFASTRLGGKGHDDLYKINDAQSISEITVVQPELSSLPKMNIAESPSINKKNVEVNEEIIVPTLSDISITEEDEFFETRAKGVISYSSDMMKEFENLEETTTVNMEEDFITQEIGLFDFLKEESHTAIGKDIEIEKPIVEIFDEEEMINLLLMEDQNIDELELNRYEKVYFIQIAALSHYTGNLERFSHFKRFGNVYAMRVGGVVKIRLGYYRTQAEAIKVLRIIKEKGIREAFVVGDILDANRLELIAGRSNNEDVQIKGSDLVPSYRSRFKVRVAAYQYPSMFQTSVISDLGHIEHWTKGQWKIIVLSGYTKLEQAEKIKMEVMKRGFRDAFIVRDQNGSLLRVK